MVSNTNTIFFICGYIESICTLGCTTHLLHLLFNLIYSAYPLILCQKLFKLCSFFCSYIMEASFPGLVIAFCQPHDHWCLPTSPSSYHQCICKLGEKKKPFFNKVENRFLSFLMSSFIMLKYANMFKNASNPLGHCLRIF